MHYSLIFNDLPTGVVADVFTTLASLIVADTTGHRLRVRSLSIGPADDTPPDVNVAVQLARIADVSAGTAGTKTAVTTGNMAKKDPSNVDSIVSGGRAYSVEPTTYETEPLYQEDINAHGGFIKEWGVDDAPVAGQDMLIAVIAAPRTAAAVRLSGTIEFETF